MGTDQEWLGDYLVHRSTIVGGSVMVIGFSAARTVLEPGAGGRAFDVTISASPENELLRIAAELWPGQAVFLPLEDPLFLRTVAYNSEDEIYLTRLSEQFDAIVQYGVAHRMPIE